MSRSLGLREDQRLGAELATRIAGLFPQKPVRSLREQVGSPHRHSHTGSPMDTLLVNTRDQLWERACSR
jgi:hypothetical protein